MTIQQEKQIQLLPVLEEEMSQFKTELQKSFTQGIIECFGDKEEGPIPSDEDIEQSLRGPEAVAYHFMLNGEKVGGVALQINPTTHRNSVNLLFISLKNLNRGLGSLAWQAVEEHYPETEVWELVTPYFEKRNIHFYVNKCGFHIVEFYCKYNPEPNHDSETGDLDKKEPSLTEEFEFFRFEKRMK